MRRYRPAAMPRTVATERKTMPNTRSPTGWYYCSYLLRLTLAGSPSAQDPEARFLSYENTVLIRADSSLEAYDKTLRIARENETSYTNEHQQDVQWKLVGITDILPIYEALEDGGGKSLLPRGRRANSKTCKNGCCRANGLPKAEAIRHYFFRRPQSMQAV